MGDAGESRMTSHQAKKLGHRCASWLSATASPSRSPTKQSSRLEFYKPPENSPELTYLRGTSRCARRQRTQPPASTRRTYRGAPAIESLCQVRVARPRAKRCPRPWPPCGCLATCFKTRPRARGSCPSWRTRRARSAWRVCSGRSASIPAVGQLYEPEDIGSMLSYSEAKTANCLKRGSPRRVHCRPGSPPRLPTASMASRCCRFTFSIPCSDSSESVT